VFHAGNPGPNILSAFRNQLTDFGEVALTMTSADAPILDPTAIGLPGTASEYSSPSGGKFTCLVRIERANTS
jgi:hypothetical protein